MVDRLSDDFTFRIVTQDRDAGEHEPYPGITRGAWVPVGRAQVMYLAPTGVSVRRLVDLVVNFMRGRFENCSCRTSY